MFFFPSTIFILCLSQYPGESGDDLQRSGQWSEAFLCFPNPSKSRTFIFIFLYPFSTFPQGGLFSLWPASPPLVQAKGISTAISLQDGEIDLKLITKVLAPEQEVQEVSEFLVNIACAFPVQACPAVSRAPGEVATLVSQVIKIYDVYINTLCSPPPIFLWLLPLFLMLSFLLRIPL